MGHLTEGTEQPVNDRMLTLDRLRHLVAEGEIDTVVVAFTDMQGRLQGKRLHAHYFLDVVLEHGTEGCNYLLGVDVDMNTVDGYAITSWERGYGDMEFVPRPGARSGCSPTCRPRRWCSATWSGPTTRPVVAVARARSCRRRSTAAAELGFTALAGTELEFIVFEDTYEEAHDRRLPGPDAGATSTTSTTRSSAPPGSSRCCATSATHVRRRA